jgi:hypothetical protein
MKISIKKLQKIIKEEIENVLKEEVDNEKIKAFSDPKNIGRRVTGSGYPGAALAGRPVMDPDGKRWEVPLKTSGPYPDYVPLQNLEFEEEYESFQKRINDPVQMDNLNSKNLGNLHYASGANPEQFGSSWADIQVDFEEELIKAIKKVIPKVSDEGLSKIQQKNLGNKLKNELQTLVRKEKDGIMQNRAIEAFIRKYAEFASKF